MPKSKKKSATNIYCRVRPVFPWEKQTKSVNVPDHETIISKSRRGKRAYTFTRVFGEESTNKDAFESICRPLIGNVKKGFNAVLMAYGQTGSGKTHTMIGKPDDRVRGLLPRILEHFIGDETVTEVSLQAVEAYGVHVSRIALYDLLSKKTTGSWEQKKGSATMDLRKLHIRVVKSKEEIDDLIAEAHANSHFAPTGKNPESSRGHTAFIIAVTKEQEMSMRTSFFVICDLAGSEGESSLTPQFVKENSSAVIMIRKLEAGCINIGLTQLQLIFSELRRKHKLSKSVGSGLRRILHPFLNVHTAISVLFAVSPTISNSTITEGTLKFAVQANKVKVQLVAAKSKQNLSKMIKNLEGKITELENVCERRINEIHDRDMAILEIQNEIERHQQRLKELDEEAANEPLPQQVSSPESKPSPTTNVSFSKNLTQPDLNDARASSRLAVDNEKKKRRHARNRTKEIQDSLLNQLKLEVADSDEEAIFEETPADRDDAEKEINREITRRMSKRKSAVFEARVFSQSLSGKAFEALLVDDEKDDEDNGICAINELKQAVDDKNEEEEEDEVFLGPSGDDFSFFKDLESLSKAQLIERMMMAQQKMNEKKLLISELQSAQVIMLDHLGETNTELHQKLNEFAVPENS